MSVSSLQSPLLLRLPSFPFLPRPPSFLPDSAFFYPQTHIRRPPFFRLRRRPSAVLPATDQELLQGLAGSADGAGDEARTHLPAVRSYEGDLARLTLVGAVSYDQALTAAAADGGDAADEHLSSGTSTMVVETVFPGGSDEHSTVSTRLDTADITVSSSDERFHSALAEAICSYTLEDSERNYLGNVGDLPSNNIFGWLQKPQKNCSVDSSIYVYRISEARSFVQISCKGDQGCTWLAWGYNV